ncbi:hypothetical protein ANABIO32_43140 [Rossellomorea marisflavi]|uniref:YwdI family protein n=1 Tax=Rossellomorea marisflavi TaxID=189381 RepID=UPI0025C78E8C|nr:YwdI family protein [Rossellomorea marisflavi]GLI86502.1 hypothetical protein ANABIO32_43140 [Rossellomorea marisflavi]
MNIPHQSLIKKMEMEIGKAKNAEKASQIREHIYTIKAMCELLLEEQAGETSAVFQQSVVQYVPQPEPISKPVTIQKEEPLETDDGANGSSLFDF